MNILGISCHYHDAGAALLRDGDLVAAAEEERFSRIKHDSRFPKHAIDFCLAQAGISASELDYAVFYEKPLLKFERTLLSTMQTFPRSAAVFREAMISWFDEKLWIRGEIVKHLGLPRQRVLFAEHHISHAASAFFCSPFEDAAIVTADGVGEWTTTAVGHGSADWGAPGAVNRLDLDAEIRFPHSLGLLYSAFTAFLGFEVNDGEYKVMGMAPYGRPTRVEDVRRVVQVEDNGAFRLDMDYLAYHHSTTRSFSRKFVDLFGEPRSPESPFYTPTTHPRRDAPGWDDRVAARNQEYADIAASLQVVVEDAMVAIAREARRRTGSRNLCMAGGVALNSVANGRIMREAGFEQVYIQPASGDSGGSLGAALYAYHVVLGQPRRFVMEHTAWGAGYDDAAIERACRDGGHRAERFPDDERTAAAIAEDLVAGRVVARMDGRFEWGPRALGQRSIIADPRRAEMKGLVNERIKFREPFRPFAPAILGERLTDYYEDVGDPLAWPYRFMLAVRPARPEMRDRIQAVTHEGGTGRVQAVQPGDNRVYRRTIELFNEATGVPVILNTSFNLRGEPIVNTPEQALSTFERSDLDAVYLGPYVVRKGRA